MGCSRMPNKSMAACLHLTDVKIEYQKKKKLIACLMNKKELAALINFRNSITTRCIISAKNAEILINKNKTLLPEDKAEDIQILKQLKTNQPASLGPLDIKRLKRITNYAVKNQKKVKVW